MYLLTKFIGAVLFVRLIRILYYAKLLADGLSGRLKSLSWAGAKAVLLLTNLTMSGAMWKTRDYTPGLICALRQGQTLLRLGGLSAPVGGLTLFYWLPGHSFGEGVNP